jgi:hypothetical protein
MSNNNKLVAIISKEKSPAVRAAGPSCTKVHQDLIQSDVEVQH